MFCPKCGKEISNQAAFCPKCGATLASRPSGTAPKKDAPPAGRASAVKEKIVKAAAARPRKDRKDKAGGGGKRIDKRKILLIAAVVFIAVLILLPKSPSSDAPDRNISSGTGQGTPDGTADGNTGSSNDGVELGKDGKRSLKGESKEYKENYNYVFDHQSEIIAAYYQDGSRDTTANNFKGTLNALRDIVASVDPKIFDMIALDAAVDNADSFLGMHLIYSGVNAYFSDSELGRGLRDISEALLLAAAQDSYKTKDDAIRKDELEFCGGNLDYALMQTRGTLEDILLQIDVDSGYNTAMAALQWYYDELYEIHGENLEEEIDIMWNGNGDQEAVQIKWDTLRGRMDAVSDCMQVWNNSRKEWIDALLKDVGLDAEFGVSFTVEDAGKRIYAIFDRDGRQYGVFTGANVRNGVFCEDGSFCFQEGWNDAQSTFRKVDRDGKTVATYGGAQLGPSLGGYRVGDDGYYFMAPCGNILHQKTESDFEHGDYQVLELVKPDGSSEELIVGWNIRPQVFYTDPYYDGVSPNVSYFYTVCGWSGGSDTYAVWDYRTLDDKKASVCIDMKTGKLDDIPEGSQGSLFVRDLNSQYTLVRDKIYDREDPTKEAADLSSGGGVVYAFWDPLRDEYWVISNSGYYYAMDKNFKRIHEPVQIPGDWYDLTPFGIILYEEDGNMGLYDAAGRQLSVFPKNDVVGFMTGNFNISTGEQLQLELTD